MPKPLEKNIEWIAVGLGVLWIGYVVWAYVLSTPTIEVGGTKLGPGAVDEKILDEDARQLKTKMDAAGEISFPPPKIADGFNDLMARTGKPISVVGLVSSPPAVKQLMAGGTKFDVVKVE